MNMLVPALLSGLGVTATVFGAGLAVERAAAQGLTKWVPSYLSGRYAPPPTNPDEPLDVFLSVCDHYEPEWGSPTVAEGVARVDAWVERYPKLFDRFRDVRGRVPQHTFFFPQDQYRPEYMDRLAILCRAGYGDVDVHLHHDNDTEDGLRQKLSGFRDDLFHKHGLLRRDPRTGEIVYGFIHGNWALCNSRPDGRWCGVDHEIPILLETGCYADFTFPSAPSSTQPRIINSIYYASDRPHGPSSHETGVLAKAGVAAPPNSLLMIQGPLGFDGGRRKFGLVPKVENGDLLASHPPSGRRIPLWLKAGVTLAGRPNWRFVKLHTHGCKPVNLDMWLGDPAVRFHEDLARYAADHPNIRLHYVTAWETAQLVHAAESQIALPSAALIDAVLNPVSASV